MAGNGLRAVRGSGLSLKPAHAALAVLIAAVWGLSFVVIKLGVRDVPPLLLTGFRFLLAAFPAMLFVRRPTAKWRLVAAYGLFIGILQFGLVFVALKQGLPAGLASVVIQSQVFITIGLAAALFGEKLKSHQISGAVIALAGIVLIAWTRWTGAGFTPLLLCLAAAVSWSFGNMVSKQSGETNPLGFIVWASAVAPLPLFALSWLLEDHSQISTALSSPGWTAVAGTTFLAWPATIFGFGTWSWLLGRYPASQITPFALLVPVFGMAGGFFFLAERIEPLAMLGSALVLAGLAMSIFGGRKLNSSPVLP
jgi:O-acetylserine/cysteine efflux transporter